jgi:NAD(P)H-dependent flavin oxidoreductase YrpB (nitropropane dioxygenase family)
MMGQRRLSQWISEGDGISLIVPVTDAEAARAAEAGGAEGLLVNTDVAGIREASALPVLRTGADGEADAWVLPSEALGDEDGVEARYRSLLDRGIECVVEVTDSDQLELVLERLDPEIFLLSPADDEGQAAVERVLDLLHDVPAGKLAIAHLLVTTPEEIAELERTGFDAVTVGTDDVAGLAGAPPPEV